MLLSQGVGRRWAMKAIGAWFAIALIEPSQVLAKRRRRKKPSKRAEPEPAAEAATDAAATDGAPQGDALKDAQLSKQDAVWCLKNRSAAQRIVVLIRAQGMDGRTALHALSLEPSQELNLGVRQPEGSKKPAVTIVSAQYN